MADPSPLGANNGATPLTASEWGEAAKGVAPAKRVGAVAVSVRHITLHLSTLEFPSGMAHGHGHLAPGPARRSRRAGLRSACCSARGASRGSGRGPAGAAPGVAASPSPSVSADDTSAETNAYASAVVLLRLLLATIVAGCAAQLFITGDAWLCAAPSPCCTCMRLLLICAV